MISRFFKIVAPACLLLIAASAAYAQAAPKPQTLADAFKMAASPDPGTVVLTVNGDWVDLTKGATAITSGADAETIAGAFGRITTDFGGVTAVAPATMTLLNAPPSEPDIHADLPTYEAFPLLVASLTDAEWNNLISEQGLSISELNTDWQKQLLARLLSPGGKLIIQPHYRAGEHWSDSDRIDDTSLLPQCRIRLQHCVQLELPIKGEGGSYYGGEWSPPVDGSREYSVANESDIIGQSNVAYGCQVKTDAPNISKDSQLDYSRQALRKRIDLTGIKTVGDLFAAIEAATGIELYADPRLDQSLQTVGAHSAIAADLLQAVALCQMATFRQVGPAYVLTDDIAGVGTRRELWAEFGELAESLRTKPIADALRYNYAHRSPKDIPWFGDPAQYTQEQASDWHNFLTADKKMLPSLRTTFDKLTPAQQAQAKAEEDEWNRAVALHESGNQEITTDGNINVDPSLKLVMFVPGMDSPAALSVNGGEFDDNLIFQGADSDAWKKLKAEQTAEITKETATPTPEDLTALVSSLDRESEDRAAVSHARTAAGVDADIAAMKKLGLNQIWLDVFSDGEARIPGSPLSDLPHKLKPGENDILTEALLKGKASGIEVFAVMDLFYWGSSPGDRVVDLNILGETSAQEEAWWNQRKALLPDGGQMSELFTTGAIVPQFPGVAVAPTEPVVQADLLALATRIARYSGIAGVVLRDTDPPGYNLAPGNLNESADLQLGFVLPARLAFLRKHHADPVDLYPNDSSGVADTSLPNFNDENYWTGTLTMHLWTDWADMRRNADLDLLASLYLAVCPSESAPGSRPEVIVMRRGQGQPMTDRLGRTTLGNVWYGSWDSVKSQPPAYRGYEQYGLGEPTEMPKSEADQAREESKSVYYPMSRETMYMLAHIHRPAAATPGGSPKSGIVLDLSDDSAGDNGEGDDPLTDLGNLLTGPTASPKPSSVSGH
jgi:hypothetical protein